MKKTSKLPSILLFLSLFVSCAQQIDESVKNNATIITVPANGKVNIPPELSYNYCYLIRANSTETSITENQPTPNYSSRSAQINGNENNQISEKVQLNNKYFSVPFHPETDLTPIYAGENYSRSNSRGVDPDTKIYQLGDAQNFYVTNEDNTFNTLHFTLKAVGSNCYIWIDDDSETNFGNSIDINAIKEKCENILPKLHNICGNNYTTVNYSNVIPTSPSTKLHVFIYDIYGDYKGEPLKGGVFGYFHSKDFFNDESYSNQEEIIYMDSYFLSNKDRETDDVNVLQNMAYSTLVHEYQHLLNFINKNLNYPKRSEGYFPWFTEMLSTLSQDLFQSEIGTTDEESSKHRLYDYNYGPQYGFANWRTGNDVYFSYANAYAFGAFLLRNYGGAKLIHEISTNEYVNEDAIINALKKLGYNETFSSLLLKFGQIQINIDGSYDNLKTLNKGNNHDVFNHITYKYTPINLRNYVNYIEGTAYDHYKYGKKITDSRYTINGPAILTNGCYYPSLSETGVYCTYGHVQDLIYNLRYKPSDMDMMLVFAD